MTIVVDASVIMKWIIPEAGSREAVALQGQILIAPSVWFAEVANGLWRHALRGELSLKDSARLLDEVATAPINTVDSKDDMRTALSLAIELVHPIYDCIYLALALREHTHVVTADMRFANLVRKRSNLKERIRPLL
jgi:predicted nucleic acid-binding protein